MAYNFYPTMYQQQYQQNQGGFVSVRSIEEAFNYPIAPGNSIMFKVENTPYVCTKTKGFSPLDQPVFERYRLVKEDVPQKPPETPSEAFDAKTEINTIWDEIKALKAAIEVIKHDQSADAVTAKKLHEQSESDA